MNTHPPLSVVMIAGEASGDIHGAHVMKSLHRMDPTISISGAGGDAMRKAGANIIVDAKELSVMGITAVLLKAPQVLKALFRLKRYIAHKRPDLLILIDFPDFNLHVAGYAKRLGIRVLYYISPTIWAWRSGRIRKIKKRVDHMAVILPFEQAIYERHRVPATYVGHPLLDDADRRPAVPRTPPDPEYGSIALLPGSRDEEVERLLPEMAKAASLIKEQKKYTKFVISCAPSINRSLVQEILDRHALTGHNVVCAPVSDIFAKCDLAIVASGTASLEAAIYGIPAIIVYQVSGFNYWLAKKLVNVPHIGLANLIGRERIFPELIQEDATADNLAAMVIGLLSDPDAYANMISGIQRVRKMLGTSGASDRVAAIACRLMGGRCAV